LGGIKMGESKSSKNDNKRIKTTDKPGDFIIQSGSNEYSIENIKEMCAKAYRGDTRKQIKTIDIYLKFEDGAFRAYYVINGKADGAYIQL